MTVREKLEYVITVTGDSAKSGIAGIKGAVSEADGTINKFKAGASSAFASIAANATTMGLAAGAAIVGFTAKAVKQFTDAALAADKFANSTGMSTEQSSRWLAVMGRWGVELGDLSDVFNNVAGLIASNDPVFERLGIRIARAADGTVDMDGTMKNLVRTMAGIEDPAERAAASAKFFGEEGARQFSELVARGKDVDEIFKSISEGKVFDEEEVEKAKRLDAAMRELSVAWETFAMALGESVAPALADTAEGLADTLGLLDKVKSLIEEMPGGTRLMEAAFKGAIPNAIGMWNDLKDAVTGGKEATEEATEVTVGYDGAADRATQRQRDLEGSTRDVSDAQQIVAEMIREATDEVERQGEEFRETTNEARTMTEQTYALHDAEYALHQSVERANETLAAEGTTLMEARQALERVAVDADRVAQQQLTLAGRTMDTKAGMDMWVQSMMNSASHLDGPLRDAVLNHISTVSGIPKNVLTLIDAEVDTARLAEVEAALNWAARMRFVRFSPSGGTAIYAAGTNYHPGGLAVINDAGPELVELPTGSKVMTAAATRTALAEGTLGAGRLGGGGMPPIQVNIIGGFMDQRTLNELTSKLEDWWRGKK